MSKERIDINYVKQLLNKVSSGNLTKYQFKGMLLEIATFNGLVDIGIYPIPLHNPFDDDYARDEHLSIDLIFRYNGETYGVECKNIRRSWEWSKDWIYKNVIARFDYVNKTVPLNEKVLVTSYPVSRNVPLEYHNITVRTETTLSNLEKITSWISESFTTLLQTLAPNLPKINPTNQNNLNNNRYTLYGHQVKDGYIILRRLYKKDYDILRRADDRLRTKFGIKGWIE